MKINDITERFDYNDARETVSPSVQTEIEKFDALSDEEKANKPLLYHLLGQGTPAFKMDKKDAEYVDKSTVKDQACANCRFAYKKVVEDDRFICSQIRGTIRPEGWCRLWKPKKT